MSRTSAAARRYALLTVAAAAIAVYFVHFAKHGLRADFTGDDLMNLYGAWRAPITVPLRELVLFFRPSETYRPAGTLFYRILFEAFGFQALPFRAACYALLAANMTLGYLLVRRLGGSRLVAGVAVLLHAYHGRFAFIYTNTGLCYDLLCFFFYTAAFWYYLRARERVFPLGWGPLAVWSVLYVLCLDSKEMSVTLPVMIGVYELAAHPPKRGRFLSWVWREGRVALLGGVVTALFVFGRVIGARGLTGNDAYRPDLRPRVYLEHAWYFLREVLYAPGWLGPKGAVAIGLLLIAAAVLWRSVPFRVAVVWMFVGILPVAFITQRAVDGVYIPLLGAALAVSLVIVEAARRVRLPDPVTFCAVLLALFALHTKYGGIDFPHLMQRGREIRHVYNELRAAEQRHAFAKNSRILFVRDPFPEDYWASTFLVYLCTRDASLEVRRADHKPEGKYDIVLSWEDGRLVELPNGPEPRRQSRRDCRPGWFPWPSAAPLWL